MQLSEKQIPYKINFKTPYSLKFKNILISNSWIQYD